jgi:D-glycero-alpha-D-manno-heptose 1-phosphate guanylyltransferase
MFEAVVLMGGFGTRLKSVSGNTPKPMVNVSGKPFVYHLLEKLERAGCNRIILSLHYMAEDIKKKILKDSPVDCELVFVVEDSPRGTGGGLKLAAESILSEKFIALNGDTFTSLDYQKFFFDNRKAEFVIAGLRVPDANRYGSMSFNEMNILTDMQEKGMSGAAIINSGTYLISKSTLLAIPQDQFSFEEEFISKSLGSAKVYLFSGDFIDIGIPEDYIRACEYLR